MTFWFSTSIELRLTASLPSTILTSFPVTANFCPYFFPLSFLPHGASHFSLCPPIHLIPGVLRLIGSQSSPSVCGESVDPAVAKKEKTGAVG